jgi:peptide/nickel transport system ATP-binding protein
MPELVGGLGGHRVRCHLTDQQRREAWETDIRPKLESVT